MAMKFRFKNIMEKGVKKLKLVEFSGILPHEKLPIEYLEGRPHILDATGGRVSLYINDSSWVGFRIGAEFTFDEYKDMIGHIRAAGKRLSDINKKIKESEKNWVGNEWEVIV